MRIAVITLALGSAVAVPSSTMLPDNFLQTAKLEAGKIFGVADAAAPAEYVTAPVQTETLTRAVMATGTLVPALNIEVGSVLSGQVAKLLVDFNDKIKKGQVLAELDARSYTLALHASAAAWDGARNDVKVYEIRLKRAALDLTQTEHQLPVFQARVDAAMSSLENAENELKRKKYLLERQTATIADIQNVQSRRDTAMAAYREAEANLANQAGLADVARADVERATAELGNARAAASKLEALWMSAKLDVERTKIISPIDGVIVGRNITEGQTLATGLEAKTLFTIAGDLGNMEVQARINESDIAGIQRGQPASFTVDAFPGRSFTADVKQIRLAPQVLASVVTYNVILTTANPDGKLLPGMTVMANIVTQQMPAGTAVPMAALRYRPRSVVASNEPAASDSVWVLRDSRPVLIPVLKGDEDGKKVMVSSDQLRPGDVVITGEKKPGGL